MPAASDLRAAVAAVTGMAARDLGRLWTPQDSAEASRDALADLLALLTEQYGLAAAAVAAEWYDLSREEAGAPGSFGALAAEPELGGVGVTAAWAAGPLFSPDPHAAGALALAEGALRRRVADAGRRTVAGSAVADPAADGWMRQARPDGCAFCQMLAGRGAVYSEESSDFASHDRCQCVAVPAWRGEERPVKPYAPSPRKREGESQERELRRVREYLEAHPRA